MRFDTTRERILDAAERLFAEHGYQGTTLRMVTAGAGANIAAVNYHFGSKQALLAAVVHRVIGPVAEERRRRLEALAAEGDATVEELVDAIIAPMVERFEAEEGVTPVVRLVGRLFVDPDPEMKAQVRRELSEAEEHQLAPLARALPHLGRDELWFRLRSVFAVTGAHLCGGLDGSPVPRGEELRALLVPFLAAGLRAPAATPPYEPALPA